MKALRLMAQLIVASTGQLFGDNQLALICRRSLVLDGINAE